MVLQSKPELVKGVNLVRNETDAPVFQTLVAEELEGRNANAVWIDSGNNCSTYALRAAGSRKIMRKVEMARCFTPFQHVEIATRLGEFVSSETELLIVPEATMLYEEGQVNEYEAEELFRDSWNSIIETVREKDLKMLVSARGDLSYLVEAESDNTVDVTETSGGTRYRSDEFETEAYRKGNCLQTTLPLWYDRKVRLVG